MDRVYTDVSESVQNRQMISRIDVKMRPSTERVKIDSKRKKQTNTEVSVFII